MEMLNCEKITHTYTIMLINVEFSLVEAPIKSGLFNPNNS